MSAHDDQPKVPVDIDWSEIRNWAEKFAQPRLVKTTSVKTYVIDGSAAQLGVGRLVQISAYEPARVRMLIHPLDNDVVLLTAQPGTSPDVLAVSPVAPVDGMVIPKGLSYPYVLYGPDAFWLNAITLTAGRVNVLKEYC
jgi:hypothetical protein